MRGVLVLLPVLCALAGCGRGEDRADVRARTTAFLAAQTSADGAGACAALSADTRAALVREEGAPCPDAVSALELGGGEVTAVSVELVSAKVDLSTGESVFLSRTSNGWRISAVGCRPVDGPPDRFPMDCELEA